jgi:hypothetical protein
MAIFSVDHSCVHETTVTLKPSSRQVDEESIYSVFRPLGIFVLFCQSPILIEAKKGRM